MNTTPLIINAAQIFTVQSLIVLGVSTGIGIGLVLFYFGWGHMKNSAILGNDYFSYRGNVKNSFARDRMDRNAITKGRKLNRTNHLSP